MKRLLIGLASVAAVAALGFGATGAFFSDREVSTGNVLQAGAIDLKVDNTCYYNGKACVDGHWAGTQDVCTCTFSQKDLSQGDVFFNLTDLKPGDWEEDTISLHVNDNNAWACMGIQETLDSDNGCNAPETAAGDPQCPTPFPTAPAPTPAGGDGELDTNLQFVFWVDDGDNVFETDEVNRRFNALEGPGQFVLNQNRVTLADASGNPFEASGSAGLLGAKTYYIGKYICYGNKTPAPVAQDGFGAVSPVPNGPNVRGAGFNCDGSLATNISQTDRWEGNISFEAVQSRNNPNFLCNPQNNLR